MKGCPWVRELSNYLAELGPKPLPQPPFQGPEASGATLGVPGEEVSNLDKREARALFWVQL